MRNYPWIMIIFLSFVPYLVNTKTPDLRFIRWRKNLTWILLDGCYGVCICAVMVLYHIHYINSWLWHLFVLTFYHILSSYFFLVQRFTFCIFLLCFYAGFHSSFFLILSWPYLQHAHWLKADSFIGYLHVSILLSIREILQTGIPVGISWKNIQACALYCSMKLTCCCFQTGP